MSRSSDDGTNKRSEMLAVRVGTPDALAIGMRPVVVAVMWSLVACAGGEQPPGPEHEDHPMCMGFVLKAACSGSSASAESFLQGGAGSHSLCRLDYPSKMECASSCAVQTTVTTMGSLIGPSFDVNNNSWQVAFSARALCAETPEARAGDACDHTTSNSEHWPVPPMKPCLPTRAHLAADGTVASQGYLTCSAGNVCALAPPPVIAHYLQACDASVLTEFGMTGVKGVVANAGTATEPFHQPACLLAWDDAAQLITSGTTNECAGDWECPSGSLCDDQVPQLDATITDPVAICKPGPRGTLTPAMLSR